MSETSIEQLLTMLRDLQLERVQLQKKITELTERKETTICLSQLPQVLSNIRRQNELSNDTRDTIDKAVDLVIKYGRLVGFT